MKLKTKQICSLAAAVAIVSMASGFAQDGIGCESAQRLADPRQAERSNPEERADAQGCLGFLEGFVWGHAWASWREAKDMWFCLPQGFTGAQGVPVVVDYLQAHPDRLDEDGHLLVFLALTAKYPCKP
jgi:hypothetical protein